MSPTIHHGPPFGEWEYYNEPQTPLRACAEADEDASTLAERAARREWTTISVPTMDDGTPIPSVEEILELTDAYLVLEHYPQDAGYFACRGCTAEENQQRDGNGKSAIGTWSINQGLGELTPACPDHVPVPVEVADGLAGSA